MLLHRMETRELGPGRSNKMTSKLSTPFFRMFGAQKRLRRVLNKSLRSAEALTKRISPAKRRGVAAQILAEIPGFGTNPGRLTMKLYVPPRLAKSAPLVVVLHGCQQTPESFDAAAGFGKLARERRFALLYPQQRRSNNSNLCFNWFRPSAVAHDRGEAMSIRQMIEFSCKQHALDRSRIYVVGLSAGGAMAGSLAFSYPHLFAGVAIVAGLPASSARDVRSAISVMQSGPKAIANGRDLVHADPITPTNRLPAVSVWQGSDDRTVNPVNADACVIQWLDAHDLRLEDGVTALKPWGTVRRWKKAGQPLVSQYSIRDLGHALPVRRSKSTPERSTDRYVVNSEVSAPLELMRLWDLTR